MFGTAQPPPPLMTDGSRIYFTEVVPARSTLTQVSTDGGEAVSIPLPFGPYVFALNVVPGRPELLVTGGPSAPQGTALWRVPVPAGQPRRIGNLFVNDATVSPDGATLYYTFGRGIFRANPDGSGRRKIFAADGGPFAIRVSPDGHLLRFSVSKGSSDTNSLWEVRPDGTHARQLLAGWNKWKNECCGNWTSDGKYFLFQATREGTANLWAMREKFDLWRKSSHEPVRLTLGELSSQGPLPNKEGTKVFFIGATHHAEVVRYDATTHAFTPYLPGLSAEGLAFSRDGKKLAYVTFPEGILWESRADGSERRQLTFAPMQAALPRWSPDGTRIVFTSRAPAKTWQIDVVAAEGGDPEQLTSGDSDSMDAVWSADGNSLIFCGEPYHLRESKEPGIHILNLKTRHMTDVPGSEGLFSPRPSPDGRTLLAMSVYFDKLELYDFAERKWQELIKVQAEYPSWTRDGKCIYFADTSSATQPVYRVCLDDRKVEHIVDLSQAGTLAEGPFGWWTGIAPDDSILATRDIGIQEIYALDVKFPQ
jgi:Tol biopolymer transport system component